MGIATGRKKASTTEAIINATKAVKGAATTRK